MNFWEGYGKTIRFCAFLDLHSDREFFFQFVVMDAFYYLDYSITALIDNCHVTPPVFRGGMTELSEWFVAHISAK